MKTKKIIALITLTMFLITMLPIMAFAYPNYRDSVAGNAKQEFKDTDNAKWAVKPISELKAKDVITGYKDGSFQPNKPVTRGEAVVMVLKSTGLAEEVKQSVENSVYGSVYLPFKDAKNIPQWVKGSLSVAVEKGYLPEDQAGSFQANKPATRLWVAKLLVRALKLADQVGAQVDVQLPFNDVAAIPQGEAAFIAVAMENGLLQGYPDNTFKPYKPVTRAEMAALLGNSDDEIPLPEVKQQKIEGNVVSVNLSTAPVADAVYDNVYSTPATGTTITILKADGTEASFPVASNVRVYIDDQSAAIENVTPGLRVELVLNKEGNVVYIESKTEAYRGRLTVIDAVYGLTLLTREGDKTFAVADDVQVIINGKQATLSDVKSGMKAGIKIEGGKVAVIKAVALKKVKEKVKDKGKEQGKEQGKEKDKNNSR